MKIERQVWQRNTWNSCAIADQIERFFFKRRCASQAGNGFLKSPSISLGENGYAKDSPASKKMLSMGVDASKNMIFYLKISWTPDKCSTRCPTLRSNSWNWTSDLGRYSSCWIAGSDVIYGTVSDVAPLPLDVFKVLLQMCHACNVYFIIQSRTRCSGWWSIYCGVYPALKLKELKL